MTVVRLLMSVRIVMRLLMRRRAVYALVVCFVMRLCLWMLCFSMKAVRRRVARLTVMLLLAVRSTVSLDKFIIRQRNEAYRSHVVPLMLVMLIVMHLEKRRGTGKVPT